MLTLLNFQIQIYTAVITASSDQLRRALSLWQLSLTYWLHFDDVINTTPCISTSYTLQNAQQSECKFQFYVSIPITILAVVTVLLAYLK